MLVLEIALGTVIGWPFNRGLSVLRTMDEAGSKSKREATAQRHEEEPRKLLKLRAGESVRPDYQLKNLLITPDDYQA